jgi:hypothetical protein
VAKLSLQIESLLLDSENPRIGSAESQRDALQKIVDDQGEKLYELAEDIVDEGLSPIERLLVLREAPNSKRYIALEGNRRVAVLKMLANPQLLASIEVRPAIRKRFGSLAERFNLSEIEPIDAFAVDTRDEGRPWIYLRHTGENEGRGVVSWTGVAAARFRGEDPALQALEFVRTYGGLDGAKQAMLGHYFPITTLDRLLSTREVRQLIGVNVAQNKLTSWLPPQEVIKPLRKIVLDLAEKKVNVSMLKNRAQQLCYVQTLAAEDRPDFSKVGPERAIETVTASDFGTGHKGRQKPRRFQTGERKTVVPGRLRLNVRDAKAASIFRELKGLRAEDFPNAGAVLLRVFLELSVDAFLTVNGISLSTQPKGGRTVDKSLAKKVEEAIDHMVKNQGANRKDFLSVSRGLSVSSSPFSIDLLHAYVHNRFVTPKDRELITAWDDAQPFFERLWQ